MKTRQPTFYAMLAAALLLGLGVLLSSPIHAGLPAAMEDDLKAAYIHNFTKFVVWPAGAFENDVSPIVIGVLGNDSVTAALQRLVVGRTVSGRPLEVRSVAGSGDLAALHVLYVAAARDAALAGPATLLSRHGLLTIGESDRFVAQGGTIRFVVHDDRLLFEINMAAAHRAGVTASSQLLKLARIVHKTP
jgi:hypothetical protein